ncbi:hypothetical protein BDF20DRAFT_42916 [Mycotypha africana]|uniref:uncharacterized protein n=1 Tax=Mycotypha africana TaxID=64632 RepID=UPI0023014C58|nr:uncharacterized protein BDF20DRAFT_42916 [Mycotypha africana]KAI8991432.1 hypothetical protein BDF20DRAFT_42916 [Mycotypha africana]
MTENVAENDGDKFNENTKCRNTVNSIAGSPNSTINHHHLESMDINHREEQEGYPAVLESAPFPALGSLEEITQTLSRMKSNQTQKSNNAKSTLADQKVAMMEGENEEDEKAITSFRQVPYPTEGIRNPGWLTVISCFLVNFFVFGTTFSWGNYQKLYV